MGLGSTSTNKFMSETNTRMCEHTRPDIVAVAAVLGNIRKHRDSSARDRRTAGSQLPII
jgi:hypothetical protein